MSSDNPAAKRDAALPVADWTRIFADSVGESSPTASPQGNECAGLPVADWTELLARSILNVPPVAPTTAPAATVRQFRLPTPGQTITNPSTGQSYVIGQYIGDGSFGVVYRATDRWDRELAVKVLKPVGTYEEVRDAAANEAEKLHTLRHTRITYVYDAFEFEDAFYIVSECCGSPASSLIDPVHDGARHLWIHPLAKCLLEALSFMHDRGYVHQDVHLNNVFLLWTKSEMVPTQRVLSFKLGDLGLAKPVREINQENTVLAGWMFPPEAICPEFGPMDHRVDIYHAALLMLQVLTGRKLELTREQILDGVPRQIADSLATPLGNALSPALRRHVEYRPATALELWESIKIAAAAEGFVSVVR